MYFSLLYLTALTYNEIRLPSGRLNVYVNISAVKVNALITLLTFFPFKFLIPV